MRALKQTITRGHSYHAKYYQGLSNLPSMQLRTFNIAALF